MIRCPHSLQRMGSRGLMSFLAPQSSLHLGYNNTRDIWCFSPAHKYSISCLGGGKKGAFVAELGCPCWFIVGFEQDSLCHACDAPSASSAHNRDDQARPLPCAVPNRIDLQMHSTVCISLRHRRNTLSGDSRPCQQYITVTTHPCLLLRCTTKSQARRSCHPGSQSQSTSPC